MTTTTQHLARAGLIVSSAFFVSRILGWLRLVVIGNVFPPSSELDAFFAAFRIPDLLFQLVAAGALSSALIPIVSGFFASDERARAWRVVSTIANLIVAALLALAVLVFIAAPWLVETIIAPGFDPATAAQTVMLTRIMLLAPIFLALGSIATSMLNAGGRFAAAAVAPIVYNLAIIGAALILTPSLGIDGLAVGVVAGAIGHLLVQLGPVHALGFRYAPRIDLADSAARQALRLMAPRAIGLGASQITFVVVTALATTLGVGAVTALTIAFTLLQIPIGVIGVPLGVVLFPTLSREVALGNVREFAHLLTRALRIIVFVMVPISVVTAILRVDIVAVLFGTSFDPASIDLTAVTLLAFLVGLVAHSLIAVLARAFYAQQDTVTPVVAAVGAVVVNTTLAIVLVEPLGLPGIALAIAIAAWLEAAALLVALRSRVRDLRLGDVGWVAVRTVVATAVAGAIGVLTRSAVGGVLVPDPTTAGLAGLPGLVVTMAVVGLVFAGTFALAAIALRITELHSIVGLMVAALRRTGRS